MMLSLAGDLLDFSQLKNGKFRKNESLFDVKKCIEEIVMIQQFKADKLGVEMFCDFSPNSQGSQMVHSNSHRLGQVVINLLSNAIKFTDREG